MGVRLGHVNLLCFHQFFVRPIFRVYKLVRSLSIFELLDLVSICTGLGPRTTGLGPRSTGLDPRTTGLGPSSTGLGPRPTWLGPEWSNLYYYLLLGACTKCDKGRNCKLEVKKHIRNNT